mmetsp:Transcript_67859/g.75970  ORF Transcript_67859/g.75970 Transcript_67859/m.75970 type:complete len:85 (-) Transcript_67859:136-390(-)
MQSIVAVHLLLIDFGCQASRVESSRAMSGQYHDQLRSIRDRTVSIVPNSDSSSTCDIFTLLLVRILAFFRKRERMREISIYHMA